jgi:hypothetical protein
MKHQSYSILWFHTFKLTLWSWGLLEKPPVVQLLKNFPTFYWTRRFIAVFTGALHWPLSWARSVQSIPSHPISLRTILILSTQVLVFPVDFMLSLWLIIGGDSAHGFLHFVDVGSVVTFRRLHTASVFKVEVFRFSVSVYMKHYVLARRYSGDLCSSGTNRHSLSPKRRQLRPHWLD